MSPEADTREDENDGEGASMSALQAAKRGQAAAPTQMWPARLQCAGLGAQ